MAEILFPKRRRCKTCGKGFRKDVILGLFDSYACASMAQPFDKPEEAPRECRTERDGHWVWKRRYRSQQEIPDKLRNDPTSQFYWCQHCGQLHIGHSRVDLTVEKQRVVRSRQELSDTLVKLRGSRELKEVAKGAGITPIRLKELEDPTSKKVELDAFYRLLNFYHIKISIVFR